jgi:hypothetical protein
MGRPLCGSPTLCRRARRAASLAAAPAQADPDNGKNAPVGGNRPAAFIVPCAPARRPVPRQQCSLAASPTHHPAVNRPNSTPSANCFGLPWRGRRRKDEPARRWQKYSPCHGFVATLEIGENAPRRPGRCSTRCSARNSKPRAPAPPGSTGRTEHAPGAGGVLIRSDGKSTLG